MRKYFLTAVLAILSVLQLAPATFAESQYYPPENWEISDFHSSIFINGDGTLRVTETIQADFTNERHHGIVRSIPYKYPSRFGTTRNIKIKLIEAVDGTNTPWDTSVSKTSGNYEVTMVTQDYSFLAGPATFHITYEVDRALNFFTEENDNGAEEFFPHDELYWNITGTDWPVVIKSASAEIHTPIPFEKTQLKYVCYTGEYGSTAQDCSMKLSNKTTIEYGTKKSLKTYEGLTAVLALPLGTIPPPSQLQKAKYFFADNWPIFIPILVLIAMIILWLLLGRDPKTTHDTIIPHYKPPRGLKPIECGIIIDEKMNPEDLTSCIIDLAVRGFIKIEETEKKGLLTKYKDYKFLLVKDWASEDLPTFEKIILETMFTRPPKMHDPKTFRHLGSTLKWFATKTTAEDLKESRITEVVLSDLKFYFPSKVHEIQKSVMGKLVLDGYFPTSPVKTRGIYIGIGVAVVIVGFLALESLITEFGLILVLPLMISGVIIAIFSTIMPRKTLKGAETYYELKGLHEYIKTAEKDRMEFQEKANIFFEKLLPYAAAFGLIKKWSSAFEGLITMPPTWYVMHGTSRFSMIVFANDLNSFGHSIQNSAFAPAKHGGAGSGASGFGGGGFSGGGFGGGGGHGV